MLASINWILVWIGVFSVFGVAVFLERWIVLKRAETDTKHLLVALRSALEDGNIAAAIQISEKERGAVAATVRAGLVKHYRENKEIEQAMQLAGLVEIARLEKRARVLSVIAHIAPLVGLLGTVLGFIQAFSEMRLSGLVDISATKIGEALEYALATTAAGLVVAIPASVAYNFLVGKIETVVLEMQTTAFEVLDLLADFKDSPYARK